MRRPVLVACLAALLLLSAGPSHATHYVWMVDDGGGHNEEGYYRQHGVDEANFSYGGDFHAQWAKMTAAGDEFTISAHGGTPLILWFDLLGFPNLTQFIGGKILIGENGAVWRKGFGPPPAGTNYPCTMLIEELPQPPAGPVQVNLMVCYAAAVPNQNLWVWPNPKSVKETMKAVLGTNGSVGFAPVQCGIGSGCARFRNPSLPVDPTHPEWVAFFAALKEHINTMLAPGGAYKGLANWLDAVPYDEHETKRQVVRNWIEFYNESFVPPKTFELISYAYDRYEGPPPPPGGRMYVEARDETEISECFERAPVDETQCELEDPVAVERSSWGRVKSLYR
jgi:hypothetical protein